MFSDFLNLFVFNSKHGLGGVVKALQSKGLFQSLAEPNLIAINGKEASFLAGGEYPYPVVQPGNGGSSITIMFKEFGVRLNFTPTVLGGDLINLKVKPEVSSLDFTNAITLDGFRVPALSTRRTETEVELQDGQTFAIAGLMNNTAEQHDVEDSRASATSRFSATVQEPRLSEEPDRARRDDHADDHQARTDGCVGGSADPRRALPGRAEEVAAEPGPLRRLAALSGRHNGAARRWIG